MPKNKKLSDESDVSSDEEIKNKSKKAKTSKSSSSKKRKDDSSDSDSGPEDRGPAKKDKPKKDAENSWCLEGMRFVKVDEFKGKVFVNIREYYEKDGKMLPGKKGISLSATQWRKLMSITDDVTAALDKF